MGKVVSAVTGPIGGILSGIDQQRSARKAGNIQAGAAQNAMNAQEQYFNYIRELLQPYADVGAPALEQQKALMGLGGAEAQQAQINQLESSPLFQSLVRQGEESLLQNASATGGLRGGNTQGALAQFRPAMLNREIANRYGQLGDMINLGTGAIGSLGKARMDTGTNISNLIMQQSLARANKAMAGGWMGSLGQGLMMAGSSPGLGNLKWADFNPFGGGAATRPTSMGGYYAGLANYM
jgi:hypothetical protein